LRKIEITLIKITSTWCEWIDLAKDFHVPD